MPYAHRTAHFFGGAPFGRATRQNACTVLRKSHPFVVIYRAILYKNPCTMLRKSYPAGMFNIGQLYKNPCTMLRESHPAGMFYKGQLYKIACTVLRRFYLEAGVEKPPQSSSAPFCRCQSPHCPCMMFLKSNPSKAFKVNRRQFFFLYRCKIQPPFYVLRYDESNGSNTLRPLLLLDGATPHHCLAGLLALCAWQP